MIRIEGLTTKQVEILDKLWSFDTTDEVLEWMKSLSEEDFKMAVTLQELVIDQLLEQPAESDVTEAQSMLRKMGIKC
jgi:transcriptional regulator of NAD metabolism